MQRFHNSNSCRVCGLECRNESSLREHYIEAHIECSVCHKRYKTQLKIRRHLRKIHNIKTGDETDSDSDYDPVEDDIRGKYVVEKNGIETVVCGYCERTFNTEEALTRHYANYHSEEKIDSDGEEIEELPHEKKPKIPTIIGGTGRGRGRPRTKVDPATATPVMCGECGVVLEDTFLLPQHMFKEHGLQVSKKYLYFYRVIE